MYFSSRGPRQNLRKPRFLRAAIAVLVFTSLTVSARAQGGPPLLTNDPGTPGPETWEINIAAAPVFTQSGVHAWQLPQFDINYGVGQRLQLTVEIPYLVETAPGQTTQRAWSNAFAGAKFRFLDNWHGWNVSTFPQFEIGGSSGAVQKGLATAGTRLLLPVEVQRNVGPLELNGEAGYFVPFSGYDERILGFAAGHQVNKRLEVIGEVYNDAVMGGLHQTTWDLGGRFGFHKGLIALFMAGRSFEQNGPDQQSFYGYFGIQILLDHNGRHLHEEESEAEPERKEPRKESP
jgi:hypothetical protein